MPAFFDFYGYGIAEGYAGCEDECWADVVQWEVETVACAVYDLTDVFGEDFYGEGYAFVFWGCCGVYAVDVTDVVETAGCSPILCFPD